MCLTSRVSEKLKNHSLKGRNLTCYLISPASSSISCPQSGSLPHLACCGWQKFLGEIVKNALFQVLSQEDLVTRATVWPRIRYFCKSPFSPPEPLTPQKVELHSLCNESFNCWSSPVGDRRGRLSGKCYLETPGSHQCGHLDGPVAETLMDAAFALGSIFDSSRMT